MLHVENRLRPPRQQLQQQSLPLEQRPVAQVVAVQPQQIEGIKAERLAAKKRTWLAKGYGSSELPGGHCKESKR